MEFFATAPDKSLAHQKVAREISHQGKLSRDNQVGSQGLGLFRPVDDQSGIPADIARRGIDLKQCNSQIRKGPIAA